MKDEGIVVVEIILIMKCNSCGKVFDIVCLVCDMLGGNGIFDEFGIVCYLVNLEVVNIYEGIYDVYVLIFGCVQIGIQVFF